MKDKTTLACVAALLVFALAPAVASAQRYDRGDRYYRGGGHSYSHSRSSFSIGFGYSSGGHHRGDYSYVNFGYHSGGPKYYGGRSHYYYDRSVCYDRPATVYYSRPVYVAAPVYVPPAPVYYGYTYSAPVYTTRSYYSCSPSYYYGGYARPRYYSYGGGSYYCR